MTDHSPFAFEVTLQLLIPPEAEQGVVADFDDDPDGMYSIAPRTASQRKKLKLYFGT